MKNISFRQYVLFVLLPIIGAAVLLYYVASNNVNMFFEHETELAATSIKGTDSLIQAYLGDLRRNVRHFTLNYEDKLES